MRRRGDGEAGLPVGHLHGGGDEVVHERAAEAVAALVERDHLHQRHADAVGEPAGDVGGDTFDFDHLPVVWTHRTTTLYRYRSAKRTYPVPVVLLFALINRPDIFDLRPGHSFVEFLLEKEAAEVQVKNPSLSVIKGIKPAPGAKALEEIKVIRPSEEEIAKGIPEVKEQFRDTFGI